MPEGETAGGVRVAPKWTAVVAPLAYLAAYVALEWLSDLHESRGVPVTPWNPGLGLLFGAMALHGARFSAILAAGYFIAEQLIAGGGLPPAKVAAIAGFVGLSYGYAAHRLRGTGQGNHGLERLRDGVALLGWGLAGALLSTALIAAFMLASGDWSLRDLPETCLPLLVGDAIGIAVFAPIVLRLARRLERQEPARALLPPADLLAVGAAVVILLAALHLLLGAEAIRYLFLLFAPVVLAAVRQGLDGACFVLAVAQFGLILILNAAGQDVRTFTEVQAEMLALTLTGLIVGAVVSERTALTARAGETAARLKTLQIEADQAARISLAGGMSSALAHEINQPITAARALSRSAQLLIEQDSADLARASRNLEKAIAQIDHAAGIVSRMREFLRRGRPHISTIDIPELLATAVSLAQAESLAADLRLKVDASSDLPPMFGDRTQLGQVLLNLIRNAAESIAGARTSEGVIVVGAAHGAEPDHIEFFVIDNGPGVPAGEIADLFEPARTTKQGGLGLGLAISAFIVQNHRGRIWLAASQPGHTEFRFAVPRDASESP